MPAATLRFARPEAPRDPNGSEDCLASAEHPPSPRDPMRLNLIEKGFPIETLFDLEGVSIGNIALGLNEEGTLVGVFIKVRLLPSTSVLVGCIVNALFLVLFATHSTSKFFGVLVILSTSRTLSMSGSHTFVSSTCEALRTKLTITGSRLVSVVP